MAKTEAGRKLTEAHNRQQHALQAAVIQDVIALWPIWNPTDPSSYKRFEDAMVVLIQSRARQSAALAARYYEDFKAAEGGE